MPQDDQAPHQELTEGQKDIINALNEPKPVDQADGAGDQGGVAETELNDETQEVTGAEV